MSGGVDIDTKLNNDLVGLILVPNDVELNNDRVDLLILIRNDVELNNDRAGVDIDTKRCRIK